MHKQTAFYIAIFATLAMVIGWHYAVYRGSSSELATRRRQVPAIREVRDRAFGTVTLLAVLFAVILYVIATRRHH